MAWDSTRKFMGLNQYISVAYNPAFDDCGNLGKSGRFEVRFYPTSQYLLSPQTSRNLHVVPKPPDSHPKLLNPKRKNPNLRRHELASPMCNFGAHVPQASNLLMAMAVWCNRSNVATAAAGMLRHIPRSSHGFK